MSMIVVCRACGREHEPNLDTIRAGTWRRCPACLLEPGGDMSPQKNISPGIHPESPGEIATPDRALACLIGGG
jgi:hypothetical protein